MASKKAPLEVEVDPSEVDPVEVDPVEVSAISTTQAA
jgi:hypothetical protein